MTNSALGAIAFAAALGIMPAMAQSTSANTNPQTPPPPAAKTTSERGTATINPTGIPPSQRNPLLADNGDVRVGKVIGTNVFNKNDKNVGSVNDVLVGADGKLNAVISANNRLVLVPWDELQFGDAKLNSDNKVLMPEATPASLKAMPAFHYQNQNQKNSAATAARRGRCTRCARSAAIGSPAPRTPALCVRPG